MTDVEPLRPEEELSAASPAGDVEHIVRVQSRDRDLGHVISIENKASHDLNASCMNHEENDILNINVTIDENDSNFAHINLDDLRASLLMNESMTELVTMTYSEEEHRDDQETDCVAVEKRNKKPLNRNSVIITQSKKERGLLTCKFCSEKFKDIASLEEHLETSAHCLRNRNFKCDLCGRKFSAQRDAERHRRTHTGEKPYVCNICSRAFARKDNLLSHQKRQHWKNGHKENGLESQQFEDDA